MATAKLAAGSAQLACFEPAVAGELLQLLQQAPHRLLVLPPQLAPDLGVGLPVLLVLGVGGQPLELVAVAVIRSYTSLSTIVSSTCSAIGVLPGEPAHTTCRAHIPDCVGSAVFVSRA